MAPKLELWQPSLNRRHLFQYSNAVLFASPKLNSVQYIVRKIFYAYFKSLSKVAC